MSDDLPGFDFDELNYDKGAQLPDQTSELQVMEQEKRVTVTQSEGIEIVGYEADDVVKIMQAMATQSDAANWTPGT